MAERVASLLPDSQGAGGSVGVSVAVVDHGTVTRAALGTTDGSTPVTPDTAFETGSAQKVLTASLLGSLLDAGKITAGRPRTASTAGPASELRAVKQRITWYDLAHEYLDQRWDRTPGNTRRTLADAFATITPALVAAGAAYSEPRVLRRALHSWAFNKNAWVEEPKEEWRRAWNG